jgi:hypothetical protein
MVDVFHRIASIVRVDRSFEFLDFSMSRESAGNDAAASFQRTGYQGCRISPPDLAMALWLYSTLPSRSFLRKEFPRQGFGRNAHGPIGRCENGSRNRAASPALIAKQSNIDQRIGNLTAKLMQRHWRHQAIAGERARDALACSRKHHEWLSSQNIRPIGPKS